jgi:hypothetical protein
MLTSTYNKILENHPKISQLSPLSPMEKLHEAMSEYLENHRYFYRSLFDYFGYIDLIIQNNMKNPEFVGKLSLKVASDICLLPDKKWHKVLIKHNYNTSFNSSGYLSRIFNALKHIPITNDTDPFLKNAINIANNREYINISRNRLNTISMYSKAS